MGQKTIVVKCGGNAAVDQAAVCRDVAALAAEGWGVVLVHGGSADIDVLAERMGLRQRRLTAPDGVSTRYTDEPTLRVLHMALAGVTKPRLVTELAAAGVSAVGLTGVDGGLLRARRKTAHRAMVDGRPQVVRDQHSGRVTSVNTSLLRSLLADGHTPVVSPPALAEDCRPVNADADRVAAAVAAALEADALVLLTGAAGVLADPADETSVLAECPVSLDAPPPLTGGGMGLKLVAAREALAGGVRRVLVGDGRVADPVHSALALGVTRIVLDTTVTNGASR
ncbi:MULTISPECIES: [LysW]-aminoadipate kinase [unclassified Streptomyces]|uniref:[LysW]-aminoadipate kinase n=1 Tax=unclassified Streptomyces TaxID=2593676 RepID=UPI0035D560D7